MSRFDPSQFHLSIDYHTSNLAKPSLPGFYLNAGYYAKEGDFVKNVLLSAGQLRKIAQAIETIVPAASHVSLPDVMWTVGSETKQEQVKSIQYLEAKKKEIDDSLRIAKEQFELTYPTGKLEIGT